jgi:hypothetical protein
MSAKAQNNSVFRRRAKKPVFGIAGVCRFVSTSSAAAGQSPKNREPLLALDNARRGLVF